jgi:hypothetical protein
MLCSTLHPSHTAPLRAAPFVLRHTCLTASLCSGARQDGSEGGDSEVQRTMLELLNQLDGFEPTQNIKVECQGCAHSPHNHHIMHYNMVGKQRDVCAFFFSMACAWRRSSASHAPLAMVTQANVWCSGCMLTVW